MSNHNYKTHHHRDIAEFLDCDEKLADEIYDIMRYDIFHSPMDWVTKEDFESAIIEAFWLIYRMEKEKQSLPQIKQNHQ